MAEPELEPRYVGGRVVAWYPADTSASKSSAKKAAKKQATPKRAASKAEEAN